jgi:hypothetical protein
MGNNKNSKILKKKNFIINHKKFSNNLQNIKQSLTILSGFSTKLILINNISLLQFKARNVELSNISQIPN